MSRVTIAEWYRRVNATWPAGELPAPSALEAIRAARRLYRFALGKTWTGTVRTTEGRRYTWIYRGQLRVNPDRPGSDGRGWRALIHDLSHYFHGRLLPDVRPHGPDHARLEIRLIKEVLRRGWLEGRLRDPEPPEPLPPDVAAAKAAAARLAALEARIKGWRTKAKRAETALRKLERTRKRLLRKAPGEGATVTI